MAVQTLSVNTSHLPDSQLQGGDKLGVLLSGDLNSGLTQVFSHPGGGSGGGVNQKWTHPTLGDGQSFFFLQKMKDRRQQLENTYILPSTYYLVQVHQPFPKVLKYLGYRFIQDTLGHFRHKTKNESYWTLRNSSFTYHVDWQ